MNVKSSSNSITAILIPFISLESSIIKLITLFEIGYFLNEMVQKVKFVTNFIFFPIGV